MIIAGIDPGKQGAIVVLDSVHSQAYKHSLRFDKQGLFDTLDFFDFLNPLKVDLLILEKVMGRKAWGATQTFNFGVGWGQVWLSIANSKLPYKLTPPQTWQKVIHEGVKATLTAKQRTMIAYKMLYPNQPIPHGPKGGAIDDNVLDALMIATYGMIKFEKILVSNIFF